MWKTFRWPTTVRLHVYVSTVLAILGISLPRFPELSWGGFQAFICFPTSQEPVYQLPEKWPLLPPMHLNFPRKENLFQNTCKEWWFLNPANPHSLFNVIVLLADLCRKLRSAGSSLFLITLEKMCFNSNLNQPTQSCTQLLPKPIIANFNHSKEGSKWQQNKESTCQWRRKRRPGLDFWVGKIP